MQLVGRVVSEAEAAECRLRWQNERALFAAELAAMYCSGGVSGGSADELEGAECMDTGAASAASAGGAATSRDSGGSRKRKFGGGAGGDDSDADTAAGGGMAPAPGHVEVCGLELPRRAAPPGGSGGAPPLVHTPAVDRNLEALALGELL